MKDPGSQKASSRGKAVVLFGIGLLSGAALGILFGGGRFSRDGEEATQTSRDKSAVTFAGTAAAKGPAGDILDRFLASGDAGGLDRTRELLSFVDGLKPGDLRAQIDALFARRKGNQGYDLVSKLYQKWVEMDRVAALRHAEKLEGKDRRTALDIVLYAWAAKEPYEVLTWSEEHGNTPEAGNALNLALRILAKSDPEGALALAEKFRSTSNHLIDTASIFSVWAEKDPYAASNRALSIHSSQEGRLALRSAAASWARSDPQSAWDWANGLERNRDRQAVLDMVFTQVVADGDTSRAIAFLDAMPAAQGRQEALERIANSLSFHDPEEAYEIVKANSRTSGDEEAYSDVFSHWARKDPYRVYQIALTELGPGPARNRAIECALIEVANGEPARALEMLGQLDEVIKDKIGSSLARVLAIADHDIAVKWAEGLPNGETKEQTLSIVLDEWARVDPLQAVAHGLQIENQSLRRRSLGSALRQWGRDDAISAMTWAVENLGAEDQDDLVPRLLGNWVNEDVGEAAEWVAALSEGELRDASVSSLVSSWSNQDLVAAGEWLKRLPSGEGRDRAAQQYASHVFETDPEAALAWAESIANESTRLSQMENFASRYLRNSPERAKRWIANSSLPPEKQANLLKRPENR